MRVELNESGRSFAAFARGGRISIPLNTTSLGPETTASCNATRFGTLGRTPGPCRMRYFRGVACRGEHL
jgi:hypothetical protein